MYSRYSVFTRYGGSYASQYEEDVYQLLSLIQCLHPNTDLTFTALDGALIRTNLSPRLLYEQASAGRYTPEMARLDADLGLPVKPIVEEVAPFTAEECLHIMQRLIDESRPKQLPAPLPSKSKAPYYQRNK
jgi:hypothetical protein